MNHNDPSEKSNSTASDYRVGIVDSIEGMASIAKPWNDLLAGSRSNTVFLTWEWLFSWAECFLRSNRRLFVLTVYKGGELVGIAPWYIQSVRRWGLPVKEISFLGMPETASDYLDVFSKPGKEKEVSEQIYRFLLDSPSLWDVLILRGIPHDSFFYFYFQNRIEADGKYVEVRPGAFSPIAILPKTEESYLAQLTPKRRKRFLSDLRVLERKGEINHQRIGSEELKPALEELYSLYRKRWGERESTIQFLEKFIRRNEGKDCVQIDFLNSDGKSIAGFLHLRYAGVLSMYLMAVDLSFDKSVSVGNILVGLSIKEAIRQRFSSYDFLAGNQDYKFYWANGGKRSLDLVFHGKKIIPLISLIGQTLRSIGKAILR